MEPSAVPARLNTSPCWVGAEPGGQPSRGRYKSDSETARLGSRLLDAPAARTIADVSHLEASPIDDSTISREREGERVLYRLSGSFDRAGAWDLRACIDREPATEVLLDFSLVRDFSDLGLAVVAHGLIAGAKHVHFRGVRQHQLRIFQYCGVVIDELRAGGFASPGTPFAHSPA